MPSSNYDRHHRPPAARSFSLAVVIFSILVALVVGFTIGVYFGG